MTSDSQSTDEEYTKAVEEASEEPVNGMAEAMEKVDLDGDFSLPVLTSHFAKCVSDPEVRLADYVNGYKEVYKFLALLGTVFGWVGSDVWAKIVTLEKYLENKEINSHYQTVKSMIAYEVEKNLIKTKKNDDPSGSRTLLRLHRALEYIIGFLHRIEDIEEEDRCSDISRKAYEETLMKYHPWVVQKAAKMAMGLLPNKRGLILKVCADGDAEAIKKAYLDFPKAVASMRKAYDLTQVFYSDNNLLDIP